MSFISWADAVALVFFVLGWSLYNWALESSRFRTRSIAAVMAQYRRQWMRVMSGRELRMIDSMLQGTLMHGVAFLASTSILMVGVLTAMLGLSDNALNMGLYLPGAMQVETAHWKLKVVVVSVVYIYAFFKFLWCYRLFNYCAILIGATAEGEEPANARHVARISAIHVQAGDHFNAGLRAFYFAVAGLGWLLHPLVMFVMTAMVLRVLWRRDFASKSLAILRGDWDEALLKKAAQTTRGDSRTES